MNEKLILKNVLFIFEFKHNLISISKLIKDSQLQIVFSNSGCFIQDLKNEEMIGSIKHQAGLYIFFPIMIMFL